MRHLVPESMLLFVLTLQVTRLATTTGYQVPSPCRPSISRRRNIPLYHDESSTMHHRHSLLLSSDDWSSFQAMDDDDEIVYGKILDKLDYAEENDSQDQKEAVGALRSAPTIERDADPISVPAGKTQVTTGRALINVASLCFTHATRNLIFVSGSQLELSEDTVLGVLAACRNELGTLFGYSAENRGVGITGGVDYVDLDGPSVIVRLKGRFWHTRQSVLDRVANYLQQRIPEIVDVQIEDPWQLTNEANDVW